MKEAEPVNVSQLNDSEDETELPDYGNGINTLGDESNDVSLDESGKMKWKIFPFEFIEFFSIIQSSLLDVNQL